MGDVLKKPMIVTGMIIGVLGSEDHEGNFHVIDVCFPELDIQRPLAHAGMDLDTIAEDGSLIADDGCWVAFVSGLEFGSSSSLGMNYHLLLDHLNGETGSAQVRFILSRNAEKLHVLLSVETQYQYPQTMMIL